MSQKTGKIGNDVKQEIGANIKILDCVKHKKPGTEYESISIFSYNSSSGISWDGSSSINTAALDT